MEIWQIIAICILALPVFYLANYLVVKRMVLQKRRQEDMMEKAVALSVARSMRSREEKFRARPRFGSRRRR